MRRSSSTTSRCGASSAGWTGSTTGAIGFPRSVQGRGRRARSARAISFCTPSRPSASIMATRKRRAASCAPGPSSRERAGDALGLQAGELHRQRLALRRDVEQALAAVVLALLLHDVALVDQLLEHAAERLLGDLQDVEQVGDLHAGMAVDEVQHPVMRPAEAELGQHVVGIADEVAVGEEQQLDEVPDRLAAVQAAARPGRLAGALRRAGNIYVSHIDIFRFDCYPKSRLRERIVPAGRARAARH